jgi:transposase
MPAKYVRPYSKGQKNDFRDAEAIAEAVQRPTAWYRARGRQGMAWKPGAGGVENPRLEQTP